MTKLKISRNIWNQIDKIQFIGLGLNWEWVCRIGTKLRFPYINILLEQNFQTAVERGPHKCDLKIETAQKRRKIL